MNDKLNQLSEEELVKINEQMMPIANDIKSKMDFLQSKYGFSLDFAFTPITQQEIDDGINQPF